MSEGSAVPDAVVLDAEATVENGGLVEIARRTCARRDFPPSLPGASVPSSPRDSSLGRTASALP